ncbi:MAG: glycosyltransferase [Betaproteobacteria bacterium]|nr:glycosyltransferase [Betaproteobacteria bacterium]
MTDLLEFVAIALLVLTLPGTLYLALLPLAGSLPATHPAAGALPGRVAILVPAHNEAAGIRRTLDNLLAIAHADGNTDVVVIADNCSDGTAAIARTAGARVLERHDATRRGKGYALDHAFTLLAAEDHVAYVVIDADSIAAGNLLASLRRHFAGGAPALQARYTVLNGDAAPRTRLAEIALAAFNVLRPRGRDRLGLSAGILGNGFALRREVLEKVPYTATSVVEDLEYHLRLVAAGIRVGFADDTEIRGDMPTGEQGSRAQRVRWEGGRLRILAEHGSALAAAILRGKWRFLDPLADLLLLPLAYHVVLLLAALALLIPLTPPLAGVAGFSVASLLIVALHILAAMRVARLPWSRLWSLANVPGYLLWKLRMLATTLAGAARSSAWIRTDRTGS